MAQSGFTPIRLYSSSTPAAVPLAANLDNSSGAELAINITDGKLFYKDNSNAVQVIGYKNVPLSTVTGTLAVGNGGTGQTSFSDGQLLIGNSSGNTLTKATLTAGSNVTITNGPGSITISASSASQVYPGAGIAVSTGSAWTTSLTAPSGAIVGTTDSQTLTNKTIRENVQVISTNTTAVASNVYVLTASLTLTLPATPTAGDWVTVQNSSGTTTAVIDRNGSNIMSLAEDLSVDQADGACFTLTYADATRGWVFT